MPKMSSRRIFYIIYCPIIFAIFMIIRNIWICIKGIFCKRRSVNRPKPATATVAAGGTKKPKLE